MSYVVTNLSAAKVAIDNEVLEVGGFNTLPVPRETPIMIELKAEGYISYTGSDDSFVDLPDFSEAISFTTDNLYDFGSQAKRGRNIYFGGQIIGSGSTVTADTPILNLAQTWNNAAVAFTGVKVNITNTASAAVSLLMDLQTDGVGKFNVTKAGIATASGELRSIHFRAVSNSGTLNIGAASDVILARDAANVLALRNSTAAQKFSVYNTYTDASNGEWAALEWSSNSLFFGTNKNGTGSTRSIQFRVGGADIFTLATNGHLTWNTDNTFDIGASGANRPRNLYVAGTGIFGSTVSGWGLQSAAAGSITWQGRAGFQSPADAVVRLTNSAATITTDITLSGASAVGGSTATFGGALAATGGITVNPASGVFFNGQAYIQTTADGVFKFSNWGSTNQFTITASGSLGASFGGGIGTGGSITIPGGSGYIFNTKGVIAAISDGLFQLRNNAGTDFTRLLLGPNDASGVSIVKNGTQFDFKTGDSSAYVNVIANAFIATAAGSGLILGSNGRFNTTGDGVFQFSNNAATNSATMTVGASNLLTLNGGLTTGGLISGTGYVDAAGRGRLLPVSDGVWKLSNNAQTDFTRLILGTNDASGVSLTKVGTALQVRLGDSSDLANLSAQQITANTGLITNFYVRTTAKTVATLTAAAIAGAGARSFVTDASVSMALGVGTIVVGGGANAVPVYSDGTNWLIG